MALINKQFLTISLLTVDLFLCSFIHQASVSKFLSTSVSCPFQLPPLCFCVCTPHAPPFALAAQLIWLPVHLPVIQRAGGGGRPSRCTESENYYPAFKEHLHCCSTGTTLCSRSVTQGLVTNSVLWC